MAISRRSVFTAAGLGLAGLSSAEGDLGQGPNGYQQKPKKRVLILFHPAHIDEEGLPTILECLWDMGVDAVAMAHIEPHGSSWKMYDLDGLPEAETGMIRELVAKELKDA